MADDLPLPADVLEMTPTQARESFTEAESQIFDSFSGHVDRKENGDLDWYYELGTMVSEIWRIATGTRPEDGGRRRRGQGDEGGRTYFSDVQGQLGPKFLERMARAKGFKTTNTLMQALRVVETFPDKVEYQAVVDRRGPEDQRLSWSHICHLCVIVDKEERDELIATCLAESWTVDELFHRLQGHRVQRVTDSESSSSSGGGRPPKLPRDFVDAVTRINKWCSTSCRLLERSWLDDDEDKGFHLKIAFEDMPQEKYTEQMLTSIVTTMSQIDELESGLRELKEVADESRIKIQEYLDWLDEAGLDENLDSVEQEQEEALGSVDS